jgi:hypothetical protein
VIMGGCRCRGWGLGGRKVMAEQVRRIIEVAELPNVAALVALRVWVGRSSR